MISGAQPVEAVSRPVPVIRCPSCNRPMRAMDRAARPIRRKGDPEAIDYYCPNCNAWLRLGAALPA